MVSCTFNKHYYLSDNLEYVTSIVATNAGQYAVLPVELGDKPRR